MERKILRPFLVILVIFLAGSFACAQSNPASKQLLQKYNNWLKNNHLDKILRAGSFSANGSNHTLVLLPSHGAEDPGLFAEKWSMLKKQLHQKDYDIYNALLFKLADYSGLKPKNITVKIITRNPEVFSANVHYDDQLRYEENMILGRGPAGLDGLELPAALNSPIQGYYQLNSSNTDLRPYEPQLEKLFKTYRHFGDSVIRVNKEVYSPEMLRLRVSNLYGQVTEGRYHEIIYITVILLNEKNGPANVRYTIDVFCAAGLLAPPRHESSYEDAANYFPGQLLKYNNNFQERFRQIIYAEK